MSPCRCTFGMDTNRKLRSRQSGFTLLELMIVVAILAIITSVGVPQYVSALRIARVAKAKHDLMTISQAIDGYTVNNGGQLPLTLYQVGFGGRRDPWGVPYCYLNYGDGTGDGLQWAVDAGLVNPSAVNVAGASGSSGGSSGSGSAAAGSAGSGSSPGISGNTPGGSGSSPGNSGTPRNGAFGFPFLFDVPQNEHGVEHGGSVANANSAVARAAAAATATAVTATVARVLSTPEVASLASSLATAGSYTIFAGVATETTRRRDRYMFPLNTDYDLFSLGPDARTTVSLGETVGLDDVIRANNGGFFGTASDY